MRSSNQSSEMRNLHINKGMRGNSLNLPKQVALV